MDTNEKQVENIPEELSIEVLPDLRQKLLTLHKSLIDLERSSYERVHGRVQPGQFLQLLLQDEQYGWLRTLSEMIVFIDEILDPKMPTNEEHVRSVLEQARKLLNPSAISEDFAAKYMDALQRDPAVVMAHKEVRDVLTRRFDGSGTTMIH
jgi:hypothetical protein